MNEILTIIEDWALNDRADGAMLINGEWGVGKSYYLRNQIIPYLNTAKNVRTKELYKCIYVSLNGITHTDQIINQIAFSKIPWSGKRGAKLAASLGGVLTNAAAKLPILSKYIGAQSTDLFKNVKLENFFDFSNNILCFDDLERIGKGVSVQDVLGYLNIHFIETHGIKCLIIGNESEIPKNNEEYFRIKEKTISRTINFNKDRVPLSDIFRRFNDDSTYHSFLKKQETYIHNIISAHQQSNLRTIIFALDTLKNIYNNDTKSTMDHKFIGENTIRFTFLISFEFKAGILKPNDANNSEWLNDIIYDAYFKKQQAEMVNRLSKKDTAQTNKEESLDVAFFNKYRLRQNPLQPLKAVYLYILSGFLNKAILENDFNEAVKWMQTIEEQQIKPETQIFKDLQQFYWEDDGDIILEKKEKVLSYAEAGSFIFWEYGSLYNVFESLQEAEFITLDELNKIEDKLLLGITKAISMQHISLKDIRFLKDQQRATKSKRIEASLKEQFRLLEAKRDKEVSEGFFEALQKTPNEFHDSEYLEYNPFEKHTATDIMDQIKGFAISSLRNLYYFFERNIRLSNINEAYSSENTEELERLITLLIDMSNATSDKAKKYHLNTIIELTKSLHLKIKTKNQDRDTPSVE